MSITRISDIAARLNADAERVALDLLGKPACRSRRELRWGWKQGLAVVIAGPKRGKWFDHSEHVGGDMLDLAARHFGCRDRALEWAAGLVGGGAHLESSRRREALPQPSPEPDDAERTRWALQIWSEAQPLIGSPAETYLQLRCGGIADDIATGDVLRFHPRCPFRMGETTVRLPAMIGLFRDMVTDKPVAIHRTALRADGNGKADMPDGGAAKRTLGPYTGAAIMLSPAETVESGLGACEGTETANSILLTGWRPVWALGGTSGVRNIPRLGGLDCLTLFPDNDGPRYRQDGTAFHPGSDAAKAAAERLAVEGLEVRIVIPPKIEADWNDLLAPARAAA